MAKASSLAGAAVALLAVALTPVQASDQLLAPNTKVRVSVVQWMPMKGAYEAWSALGGEFTVSGAAMLTLPIIGSVDVGALDAPSLATEISSRLQRAMGTVEKPDTTVEVLEYPPVYVVGDVNTPGSYEFRAGLTVLQAFARSGGARREAGRARDEVNLVGNLREYENDILRAGARIARLQAELSGGSDIAFPAQPNDPAGKRLASEVYAQEQTIFAARASELDRQTKSLTELRELLNAEIGVLEQKTLAVDASLAATESELKGVSVLVDKGIALASRRSDLERLLAAHRTDRLDQVTAMMRVRQGVAEATRNLDGLRDRRRTEVASDLQQAQSELERTMLKRDTAQKLLLETLSVTTADGNAASLDYTIVRRANGDAAEFQATEATPLLPGDVVKVTLRTTPSAAEAQDAPTKLSEVVR